MVEGDQSFKKPFPIEKHNRKRRTLKEDEYLQSIEKIIERDFHPDMDTLRLQAAYLDAAEKGDMSLVQHILKEKCYGNLSTERGSPCSRFETPSESGITTPLGDVGGTEGTDDFAPEVGDNISVADTDADGGKGLDDFLRKYRSEDDVDYAKLMSEAEKQRRLKCPWLYKTESGASKFLLPASESESSSGVGGWDYKAKNALMYIPEGVKLSDKEEQELSAVEPVVLEHENTRFKTDPFAAVADTQAIREAALKKVSMFKDRVGPDGISLIKSRTPVRDIYGGEAYRALGFVSAPSPVPGALGESPFSTWGEIDGTPIRLDPGSTPVVKSLGIATPHFNPPAPTKRDEIAQKLFDKISSKKQAERKKQQHSSSSSFRRLTSPSMPYGGQFARSPRIAYSSTPIQERIASLSPAAKKLISSSRIRLPSSQSSTGQHTPRSKIASRNNRTPVKTPPDVRQETAEERACRFLDSLTDGILHINKK